LVAEQVTRCASAPCQLNQGLLLLSHLLRSVTFATNEGTEFEPMTIDPNSLIDDQPSSPNSVWDASVVEVSNTIMSAWASLYASNTLMTLQAMVVVAAASFALAGHGSGCGCFNCCCHLLRF